MTHTKKSEFIQVKDVGLGRQFPVQPYSLSAQNAPKQQLPPGPWEITDSPVDKLSRASASSAVHHGEGLDLRTRPPSDFRSIRGVDDSRGHHRLLSRPEGYLGLSRDQGTRDGLRYLPDIAQRYPEDCTSTCQANGGHATMRHSPHGPVRRVTSARGKRSRSVCAGHGSRHHLDLVRCRSGNPDTRVECGR